MFLYLDRDTAIHRLSPITKIIGLVLIFVLPLFSDRPELALIPLAFVGALVLWAECWINFRRIWVFLLFLLLFSTVLWSVFHREGVPLFHLGPVRVSVASLLYGLAMGMRLDVMLIAGIVFLSCTRIEEFTVGLRRMGLPFSICFALSLAFRLVPLFFRRTQIVVEAQKSRGLDLETGGMASKMRKYVPLLVPIFVSAVRDTDLLAMALEGKGFGARGDRTYYLEVEMKGRDYGVLGLLTAADVCFFVFL